MKKVMFLVLVALLAGCASAPAAPTSVLGPWDYKLIDGNKNTWDQGTLTLTGTEAGGTWERQDYYGEKDQGSWTFQNGSLTLTGPVSVQARFQGNLLKGHWSVADGDSGDFQATKK